MSALRRGRGVRVLVSAAKDPTKVRAGQLGGRARWGTDHDAKIVKLDSLSVEQRALVLALVHAAKDQAANSQKDASATNADVLEVRDDATPPRA
jgi:hypothetical protein